MFFKTYFLVGGAGFLGSHFIDALLKQTTTQKVVIYDNFSSGRMWHYAHHQSDHRLTIVSADVKEFDKLRESMQGCEVVIHLASNPDIARASSEPSIDFLEGTMLTHHVLEAARQTRVKRLLYTSGSGVYGDVGMQETAENYSPMRPISTYGASKLAGEALISSYCHLFQMTAAAFRFGNIVGPRQTHGVGLDFIKKLLQNPSQLTILGDGMQSKSYIHVEDAVSAVLWANEKQTFAYDVYNVATNDYITVQDIAKITIESMGITDPILFQYTGGDRGWKGDVPRVRLNTDKIRMLGWTCQRHSAMAIKDSVISMLKDIKKGILMT